MASPPLRPSPRACDVLLISCYELGHEPRGVTVPAGVLERRGIASAVLDLAVSPLDEAAVRNARIVAFSTPMHTALRLAVPAARRVRALNPRAHVAFYGLYAELNAVHLRAVVDSILGAEFEADLADLVARVLHADPEDARAVRTGGEHVPARRSRGRTLDLTPAAGRFPHRDHYARLAIGDERHDVVAVETTRGCKHRCRHCPLPASYDGFFYALPAARILDEIECAVERGARHVTFTDADFLNGPTHARRVARDLHRRFPHVTFDFTAKIEHLCTNEPLLMEMRDLGCLFVVSAVESTNDEVLRHLAKHHTRADAIRAVRMLHRLGLSLRPTLVPFTPWETRASLADLVDVVASEGLVDAIDPVQYSIRLLIPEGSLLLGDASLRDRLGAFATDTFTYPWVHVDPAMDALQRALVRIAEEATAIGATARETFPRVCAEIAPGRVPVTAPHAAIPAPRLTEDWFC